LKVLSKWVSEDRIIRKYHVIERLESAPEALSLLFTGRNTGKLFVPLLYLFDTDVLTHAISELLVFLSLTRNTEWRFYLCCLTFDCA
jgi:hypothetical protein